MTLSDPPRTDELEVSLFGPGVGECVVVHVGAGEWIVVDSCIDPSTRSPVALDYLRALGVDVASAVKRVIVTHWHDDHMRGASRVLAAAKSARFVCSAALRRPEFMQFVAEESALGMKADASSGIAEFAAIMKMLKERRAGGVPASAVGPEWVRADSLVYRRAAGSVPGCEVFALSPSSATLSRGLHEIAALLPKVGAPKRAAVSLDPNDTSVVLSIQVGAEVALLGSDLETGSSSTSGWNAVLTTVARPPHPARIFKVPHHGSANAYHRDVWTNMLPMTDVIAALTPFSRGHRYLPSEEDIVRMKGHTTHLYATARRPGRVTLSDSVVERTVREVARDFRPRTSRMGHVRVRIASASATPQVELFGAAFAA